jgi:hypothetical protein
MSAFAHKRHPQEDFAHPWMVSPRASIATNFSILAARVPGVFASWTRYKTAYRLAALTVLKNAFADLFF